MPPRFLADENFNAKIIAGVLRREPSIDFQTANAAGILGLPDEEVLATAAREGRLLVCCGRSTRCRRRANSGSETWLKDPQTGIESWKFTGNRHDRETMPGHFHRFIAGSESAGLIIVSQNLAIREAIEEIVLVWAASVAEEWRGGIIFLPI
jgi:hypothetical protein